MPAERGYSITEIIQLLKEYDFSHQRRLTFEYIVFKGVNDSNMHARRLLKLLDGLDCRINLIRYHAIPEVPLEGVDNESMTRFRDYLTANGIFTTIRASRGEDIFAACGMLSTAKQNQQKETNYNNRYEEISNSDNCNDFRSMQQRQSYTIQACIKRTTLRSTGSM
jgi:23S rRNA (adenine2503-C2)-methyltransferase